MTGTVSLIGPFGSSTVAVTVGSQFAGTFDMPSDFLTAVGFPEHHSFTATVENGVDTSAPLALTVTPQALALPNDAPGAITVDSIAADTLWQEMGYEVGDKLYVVKISGGEYDPVGSDWPNGNPAFTDVGAFPYVIAVYRATSADAYVGMDTATFNTSGLITGGDGIIGSIISDVVGDVVGSVVS